MTCQRHVWLTSPANPDHSIKAGQWRARTELKRGDTMPRFRPTYILLFVSVIRPALAQDRTELWRRCTCCPSSTEASGTSADLIIGACTSLIQSGGESTQGLALAFTNRGWQYGYAKTEFDQGLADLNVAIQLQPNYARAWADRCLLKAKKGDYDAALSDCNNRHWARSERSESVGISGRYFLGKRRIRSCHRRLYQGN
jgi:hypothetical protein